MKEFETDCKSVLLFFKTTMGVLKQLRIGQLETGLVFYFFVRIKNILTGKISYRQHRH